MKRTEIPTTLSKAINCTSISAAKVHFQSHFDRDVAVTAAADIEVE